VISPETDRQAAASPGSRSGSFDDRFSPDVVPIVFVGGTGRSGTHVVARFLGRHNRLTTIPVECRFHVDANGFPGLLDGRVSKTRFLRKLRGFWWKGRQTGRTRGMFRFVEPEDFERGIARFEAEFDEDPRTACRNLFLDILWPRAQRKGASGIVEQSCDTIAASATLVELFPEAKFIHVVRDGRDASASRVAQNRRVLYPRTRRQGIEWWEARIRRIDEGAKAIPEGRFLEIGLEDLLTPPRKRVGKEVALFAGVRLGRKMRRFFWGTMDTGAANTARWREGLKESELEAIDRKYAETLERLEADGITCAPILRRSYEASMSAEWPPPATKPTRPSDDLEIR
jgi:Sulfotransferase family